MEAEVRPPRLVDDQGHAVGMGHRGVRRDIGDRPHVGGLDEKDRFGPPVLGQRLLDALDRHVSWKSGGGVDIWAYPDRSHSGQHHAEQERTVQCPRDDDCVTRATEGHHQGLVAMRRSADRDPTPVGAPCACEPAIRLGDRPGLLSNRVDATVERDVVADDGPDEV